jgi:spore coat protein CotH
MSKRAAGAATLSLGIIVLLSGPAARAQEKAQPADRDLFGLSKVWRIDLHLSAKEYERMQPAGGGFGPPGFAPPAPKPADKTADTHKGGFGMEFPWARAEFTAGGKTFKDVGIRYKGNFTYMASSRGLKRPFKIDLDRHVAEQRFCGLKKFNLHNGVTDVTLAREALSYAVFRAAGVPAPRTAFAEVTLTVPEKYDREYVGIYTLTEQVDKTFLKDRFKNSKGMLLKPEGLQGGLPHLGTDWKRYEQGYRPQDEPTEAQKKRLIEFTRLVNVTDDARFEKEIGAHLDVDAFLRFLAANALLANLDSFLAFGHNYYLYLRPDTDRFVFIAWDTDLSLGAWPAGGTPEQQLELSVMHPHAGQNKLIDRLLAIKDVGDRYREVLRELTTTCFTRKRMGEDLDAIEKAVKEPQALEARAVRARREGGAGFGFGMPGQFGQSVPPRMFIEKRPEAVAAQLAGKSKGFVPRSFGFGFGGPPPVPPPGQVMPAPLQDALGLTADQKQKVAELQKEIDRKIEEILTDDQKARLKRLREARPGGPGFGPFPGGPPGPGRPFP